jgi:hypothetical protein
MTYNLGICGAHRTGKTTLAKALDMPYISINAGEVFVRYRFSPEAKLDIRTRLFIQQKILAQADNIWFEADEPFVCDRTPIDMAAYLLADVGNGDLDQFTQDEIIDYATDCVRLTKKYFERIILLPPSIKSVWEPNKGAINGALIYKLHWLIIGLMHDFDVKYQMMPVNVTDLQERVEYVNYINAVTDRLNNV